MFLTENEFIEEFKKEPRRNNQRQSGDGPSPRY